MKSRVLRQAALSLERRERALRDRFLTPVWHISSWEPHSADYAGAYIGLLHSEAEYTLESLVRLLLTNAHAKTVHFAASPLLLNCCLFYKSQINRRLADIGLVPNRKELEADVTKLLEVWSTLGARAYFDHLIGTNHGAGLQYIEKLFHPLGIVITAKPFRQTSSAGVKKVLDLGSRTTTMGTEFVLLRGTAVHAGTKHFQDAIKTDSPATIATRGEGVVEFVKEVADALATNAW